VKSTWLKNSNMHVTDVLMWKWCVKIVTICKRLLNFKRPMHANTRILKSDIIHTVTDVMKIINT